MAAPTDVVSVAARGIMPTRAWDLLAGRVLRVYSSMDRFTGHRGSEDRGPRTADRD